MEQIGYFAPWGFQDLLRKELTDIEEEYGQLIIARGPLQKVYWAQNIWYNPERISFNSISDAAKKLKNVQSLWSFYPHQYIRKGKLISSKLPYFSSKPLVFPSGMPKAPLGSFLILDETTLLASAHCSSPFAQGQFFFQESKKPPSRAYLKLYEALTRAQCLPKKDDICLEIGASPGSWTYVLQSLGAKVISVDKAPLDPRISSLSDVTFLKKDAFSLNPKDFSEVTWLLSDVICYPEKLLSWIKKYLEINPDVKCICTLKFQGQSHYEIAKEFEKIPQSEVLHLFHNKHELTWIKH